MTDRTDPRDGRLIISTLEGLTPSSGSVLRYTHTTTTDPDERTTK